MRLNKFEAVKELKNRKSPGCDGVPAELWKAAGESGIKLLYRICVDIWTKKEWPKDWTKLVLVVPKTGNKQDCNNYRHISLICHASRVLLIIILNRLRQYSDRELPEEQTGFRAGKGTRDALLQLVIEKTIDTADKELTFIDY